MLHNLFRKPGICLLLQVGLFDSCDAWSCNAVPHSGPVTRLSDVRRLPGFVFQFSQPLTRTMIRKHVSCARVCHDNPCHNRFH